MFLDLWLLMYRISELLFCDHCCSGFARLTRVSSSCLFWSFGFVLFNIYYGCFGNYGVLGTSLLVDSSYLQS